MKTLGRDQAGELWDKYWREMSSEWFKLEVLQDYTPEDDGPSLRAWLAGDHEKSMELLNADPEPKFTKMCVDRTAQGVKLLRVHVIEEPSTPYMQWEIEFYKKVSVPLRHEQVLIIAKEDTKELNLPGGDLMLFDENRAIQNTYKNGLMTSQTFYDEHDDLSEFSALRKALKLRAKPLI